MVPNDRGSSVELNKIEQLKPWKWPQPGSCFPVAIIFHDCQDVQSAPEVGSIGRAGSDTAESCKAILHAPGVARTPGGAVPGPLETRARGIWAQLFLCFIRHMKLSGGHMGICCLYWRSQRTRPGWDGLGMDTSLPQQSTHMLGEWKQLSFAKLYLQWVRCTII